MSLRRILIGPFAYSKLHIHSLSSFSFSHPQKPSNESHQNKKQEDPYTLIKEDPVTICSHIWLKSFSSSKDCTFPNLTGFLSKFELWVLAYQRSVAHFNGSFPSINAISSQVLCDLLSLRNAVIKGHFKWNMKEQPYICSPFEKPLFNTKRKDVQSDYVLPCFQNRIVQEVLLLILEPIFESRFSSKSHAFRPGRNAHTVIRSIRSSFAGYLWFLRGDLTGIMENVDRNLVLGCLEKVIKDKRVLSIIGSALVNHVGVESSEVRGKKKKRKEGRKKCLNPNEPKSDPYWLRIFFDFAPEEVAKVPNYAHCGILSPLLANICLNELDNMVEEKIGQLFRSSSIEDDGCCNPSVSWPEFVSLRGKDTKTKKMDYIRYGAHFLIGVRGARENAVEIKEELIDFCCRKLGMSLKVNIEHVCRGIQFLDHVICHRMIYPTFRHTDSGGKVTSRKGVGTLLSVTASLPQCIRKFRHLQLLKGDKDPEPLACSPMLYSSQAHTNAQMNKLLETMADWYQFADNRKKVVGFCAYVIRNSVAKLYAARYKLKSRAKVYRIASRDLSHPLRKTRNLVASEGSDLWRLGLIDVIEGVQFSRMSMIPGCDYTPFPRPWVPDHEQILLEYIKFQDPKFFSELLTRVKTQGLKVPQDEISQFVWDFKTLGVRRFDAESRRHLLCMLGTNIG